MAERVHFCMSYDRDPVQTRANPLQCPRGFRSQVTMMGVGSAYLGGKYLIACVWFAPFVLGLQSTARQHSSWRHIPRVRRNDGKNALLLVPSPTLALHGSTNSSNNNEYGIGTNILQKLHFYEGFLNLCDQKPLITKSLAACILSGLGDVMAQLWDMREYHHRTTTPAVAAVSFNSRRLVSFMLMGLLVEGPYFHFWFELLWFVGSSLEKQRQQRSSQLSKTTTLAQVILDQTVGVAIFFPAYFYLFECIESLVFWKGNDKKWNCSLYNTLASSYSHLQSSLRCRICSIANAVPRFDLAHTHCLEQVGNIWRTQYCIWPAANWIIFRYVPRALRVTCSNMVAVLWNAYLHTQVIAPATG